MINMRKLASVDMSTSEGLKKLALGVLFVPVPILILTGGGFWLDYYKLNTLPLFLAVGVVLGTFVAFVGVCRIITYGHKGVAKNG